MVTSPVSVLVPAVFAMVRVPDTVVAPVTVSEFWQVKRPATLSATGTPAPMVSVLVVAWVSVPPL